MKTQFIQLLEEKMGQAITPVSKPVSKNNFVSAKKVFKADINKSSYDFFVSRFKNYYVKVYSNNRFYDVCNIVVEEQNPENSGFTLYEFMNKFGSYRLFYTCLFDIYGLMFANEARILKDIQIIKNTITFKIRDLELINFTEHRIITRDSALKDLFQTFVDMPIKTSIVFNQRQFDKTENGQIKCTLLFANAGEK